MAQQIIATSSSGLTALAAPSSTVIRCYDTNTASLKFTLRIPKSSSTDEVHELQKLTFAPPFLCASTADNALLVFDINRGVASQSIQVDEKETLCDVASANKKVYALTYHSHGDKYKVRVLQYDCETGKLEKKIKVGSSKSTVLGFDLATFAGADTVMCIRLGETLKLCDLAGDKLDKVDLSSSQTSVVKCSADGSYLLAASGEDTAILFWLVKEKKVKMHPVAVLKTGAVGTADIAVSSKSIHVSAFTYGVGACYFSIPSDIQSSKLDGMVPTLPTATMSTKVETALLSSTFHSSCDEIQLVYRHASNAPGSSTILPVESMSLTDLSGSITLAPPSDEKDKNKKRKAGGAMAPGETGMEAGMTQDLTSKKKRTAVEAVDEDGKDVGPAVAAPEEDDDFELEQDGEVGTSIAERLAMLSSTMEQTTDEEDFEEEADDNNATQQPRQKAKFSAKTATTESLTTLLTQALSSNDSIQLNIALQVNDPRLVENTVKSLQILDAQRPDPDNTEGYIPMLMGHIVRRMARRHTLVTSLMSWIKAILLASSQISSRRSALKGGEEEERIAREGRELASKLGPLRNFLNERVECFPQLLRLEGRLALLGQQL